MLFVCLRSDYRVSEDVSFRIAVAVRMAVADSANEITDVLDMASGRSDGACTERAYHRRLLSILRHVETGDGGGFGIAAEHAGHYRVAHQEA